MRLASRANTPFVNSSERSREARSTSTPTRALAATMATTKSRVCEIARSKQLNSGETPSYVVSETVCVYCREAVFRLTKANLKRLFPDRKEEIEARFKSRNSLPTTVEEAGALLRLLNEPRPSAQ